MKELLSAWSISPKRHQTDFKRSFCFFHPWFNTLTFTHKHTLKRTVKKLNQELGLSVVQLIWWVAKEHEMKPGEGPGMTSVMEILAATGSA